MADQVTDNPARHRFELTVEGHTAFAVYALAGDVITFVHTEVPKELAGRGVGSTLAQGALENVRARNLKVIAECPFIAGYIKKHVEYAGLLA
jgi:predicted GNAT family acetyltransferase